MTAKQIEDIKSRAASMSPEEKASYLGGVRDGLDLGIMIADDNKWLLAKDRNTWVILDWLRAQERQKGMASRNGQNGALL